MTQGKPIAVLVGVAFYLTSPYQRYLLEMKDMRALLVYLLLPIYVGAVMGVITKKGWMISLILSAIALAGIGTVDSVALFVVSGITLLVALVSKVWMLLGTLAMGMVLCAPAVYRLVMLLFTPAFDEAGYQICNITEKGYVAGQFFTLFVHQKAHPGMGPWIFTGLCLAVYLIFVRGIKTDRFLRGTGALTFLLCVCSLKSFPWEYVQRLGLWALRFVSLLETPIVFFGMAQLGLSIIGAWAVWQIGKDNERVCFWNR